MQSESQIISPKLAKEIADDLTRFKSSDPFDSANLIGATKSKAIQAAINFFINEYESKVKGIETVMYPVERRVVLKCIDVEWSEHIAIMDELRNGIGLRSYAQDNPLQAYVEEGYRLFENMMQNIDETIVIFFMTLQIEFDDEARKYLEANQSANPENKC